jgi:hypothetical protein
MLQVGTIPGLGLDVTSIASAARPKFDFCWQRPLLHSKISGHFERLFIISMYDLIELVGT